MKQRGFVESSPRLPPKCYLTQQCVCMLFVTTWTAACQAPLSMGLSRQGHWSELPFTPLGDPPYPRIESAPPVSLSLASRLLPLSHLGSPHTAIAMIKPGDSVKFVYTECLSCSREFII